MDGFDLFPDGFDLFPDARIDPGFPDISGASPVHGHPKFKINFFSSKLRKSNFFYISIKLSNKL